MPRIPVDLTVQSATFFALGGIPYSIDKYKAIQLVSKSDLSKKQGNFDRLCIWINDSLPFEHMRIRDGQLCLEFSRIVKQFNEGMNLTREVMKKATYLESRGCHLAHTLL